MSRVWYSKLPRSSPSDRTAPTVWEVAMGYTSDHEPKSDLFDDKLALVRDFFDAFA